MTNLMTHRFGILSAAALLVLPIGTTASADEPVVVELFTSQGCSSCPPADAFFAELADRDDVIALALHVDYWDYIGWQDTFAQAAFTQRQHAYARAANSTMVYTPQMVIGGVDHVIGTHAMEVADAIAAQRSTPDPVSVEATQTQNGWQVRATWEGQGQAPAMVVQVVTYSPAEEVAISRGENAGLSVNYHNVVRSWQVVAEWSGAADFDAQVVPSSDIPHVVIVQAGSHGPILAAERLN